MDNNFPEILANNFTTPVSYIKIRLENAEMIVLKSYAKLLWSNEFLLQTGSLIPISLKHN